MSQVEGFGYGFKRTLAGWDRPLESVADRMALRGRGHDAARRPAVADEMDRKARLAQGLGQRGIRGAWGRIREEGDVLDRVALAREDVDPLEPTVPLEGRGPARLA